MTHRSSQDESHRAAERALAGNLFNQAWELLERDPRSAEDTDRLIHLAHASRLHWDNVGSDQERAIGEWQVSRVYVALGRPEPALFHAERCVEYARRSGVEDWVEVSALEALARALAADGQWTSARETRDQAVAMLPGIEDAEDREVVAADLASLSSLSGE